MSLTKLTTDLENIQALSDTPNSTEGLTADELKALFDKAPTDIKTYINDTLTTEVDTALGLKVNTANIVNTLVSTSTTLPLSAAQGKALQDGKLNITDSYKQGIDVADLDNATTSGCYSFAPTTTHIPGGTTYGTVFVMSSSGITKPASTGYCVQLAFPVNSTTVHIRQKIDSGVWSSWATLLS